MANPYQQQVFQRKLIYLGLMVALLAGSWGFRTYAVEPRARAAGLLEESRGDVELLGYAVRTTLSGMRGMVTCALWVRAQTEQKKNQWNKLEITVKQLTRLQPHLVTPWLFQSWNLAYNVSVESDRVNDKYFYITRGIQLLAQGERQNRLQPDLRREVGFYHQHKIGQSDENNTLRSLFQLSCIPPADRDPENFREANGDIRLDELRKFCETHPQLARRLHSPPLPFDPRKEHPKFRCASAGEMVQFLEDNKNVPSLFVSRLESQKGYEQKTLREDTLDRFPVLPPRRSGMYDEDDPTAEGLGGNVPDEFDPFIVARAWYGYSQECLPPPGDSPGSSEPIHDRSRYRMNRFMSTIIFRSAPARAQIFIAERLQGEGWYDDEQFLLRGWFKRSRSSEDRPVLIGFRHSWSADAWGRAHAMWKQFGLNNHLEFTNEGLRADMERKAKQFQEEMKANPQSQRARTDPEQLPERLKELHDAQKYLAELAGGRSLSGYNHFRMRGEVEMHPRTVTSRKLFYQSEQKRLAEQKLHEALELLERPEALRAWREVLELNPTFRKDEHIQEQTFEMDLKYARLYRRLNEDKLAPDLALLAGLGQAVAGAGPGPDWAVLSLFGWPQTQPEFVVVGPLERDSNGKPFVTDFIKDGVLVRRGLKKAGPPPGVTMPAGMQPGMAPGMPLPGVPAPGGPHP